MHRLSTPRASNCDVWRSGNTPANLCLLWLIFFIVRAPLPKAWVFYRCPKSLMSKFRPFHTHTPQIGFRWGPMWSEMVQHVMRGMSQPCRKSLHNVHPNLRRKPDSDTPFGKYDSDTLRQPTRIRTPGFGYRCTMFDTRRPSFARGRCNTCFGSCPGRYQTKESVFGDASGGRPEQLSSTSHVLPLLSSFKSLAPR